MQQLYNLVLRKGEEKKKNNNNNNNNNSFAGKILREVSRIIEKPLRKQTPKPRDDPVGRITFGSLDPGPTDQTIIVQRKNSWDFLSWCSSCGYENNTTYWLLDLSK